jgi:hypothetical protein
VSENRKSTVETFKALGEFAMLPAVSISKLVKDVLADAAEAEAHGDMWTANDKLEWAEFLESEMSA